MPLPQLIEESFARKAAKAQLDEQVARLLEQRARLEREIAQLERNIALRTSGVAAGRSRGASSKQEPAFPSEPGSGHTRGLPVRDAAAEPSVTLQTRPSSFRDQLMEVLREADRPLTPLELTRRLQARLPDRHPEKLRKHVIVALNKYRGHFCKIKHGLFLPAVPASM